MATQPKSRKPALLIAGAVFALIVIVAVALAAGSGTSRSSAGYRNPVTLANDLRGLVNARLADSSSSYYEPGVSVTDISCVPVSGSTLTFTCVGNLSDGTADNTTVDVAPDGKTYVTH